MTDSIWFTTRSSLFRGDAAAWHEVAAYAPPLERLLRRRYAWLVAQDREDLVHDILLEIRGQLAATHDRARGPFRALLQTVVRRRVTDLLRRRRGEPLTEAAAAALEAPGPDEVEALDLEAALVDAVAACRDRLTQGPARDTDALYALVDRLVHGKTNQQIAAANGVSIDRVARLLRRARDEIFRRLVARELGSELGPDAEEGQQQQQRDRRLAADDPRLPPLVTALKRSLQQPSATRDALASVGDPRLRETLEALIGRVRAALPRFRGDETAAGIELRRGVALVLGVDDRADDAAPTR